ncbi:MAG TPA: HAD family phosphatase, partial [Nitrospiraceae bacterium]|nr:HAD family phosphatase [Nitrospiraceae bacterium]
MLKAIIFDFDGVITDSEPVHLKMFQKVLKEMGISLNEKEYYEKYLGMDD